VQAETDMDHYRQANALGGAELIEGICLRCERRLHTPSFALQHFNSAAVAEISLCNAFLGSLSKALRYAIKRVLF